MAGQILFLPRRCPECRTGEPNEITDKQGTAYQCVRCGHVWAPTVTTVETAKYGISFKLQECPPDIDRQMREYIQELIFGAFNVSAALARDKPASNPSAPPKALPPSESDDTL